MVILKWMRQGRLFFFFFFLKGTIVGPNKCIVCFKVWKLRGMWAGWQHDGYLCCCCFECNLPPGSAGSRCVRVVPVAHCGEINEIPKIHSTQRKWPELTWPKLVRSTGAGSDYWGHSRRDQMEPNWAESLTAAFHRFDFHLLLAPT